MHLPPMSTDFRPSGVKSSLAAFCLTLIALGSGACADDGSDTGGTGGVGTAMGGGTGIAGAGALGGGAAIGGATGGVTTPSCIAAASPSPVAMRPGEACLTCHATQAPVLTLGGNVFDSATGTNAVAGATVTIVDAANAITTLVTGTDGSFYTGKAIAYPAKVAVSKCPDTAAMVSTVTTGDCNSCHGAAMRIHLP